MGLTDDMDMPDKDETTGMEGGTFDDVTRETRERTQDEMDDTM